MDEIVGSHLQGSLICVKISHTRSMTSVKTGDSSSTPSQNSGKLLYWLSEDKIEGN
jgi:hypothetical protein